MADMGLLLRHSNIFYSPYIIITLWPPNKLWENCKLHPSFNPLLIFFKFSKYQMFFRVAWCCGPNTNWDVARLLKANLLFIHFSPVSQHPKYLDHSMRQEKWFANPLILSFALVLCSSVSLLIFFKLHQPF